MADSIDESSDVLTVKDVGSVRVLTLNRPEKRNALNFSLTKALLEALRVASATSEVRGVVLTGAGKGFCAGADIGEFDDLMPDNPILVSERARLTTSLHMQLVQMTKPIVSAVRGAAVGGGAGLAIGCDMMVVAGDVKFGFPETRRSVVPAVVMTSLQRNFGRKLAFELITLGRLLGGEELRAAGVANRVVEPDEVVDEATRIASAWSELNPMAIAATKRLFYRVADLPFDAAMAAGEDVNTIMRGFREFQ